MLGHVCWSEEFCYIKDEDVAENGVVIAMPLGRRRFLSSHPESKYEDPVDCQLGSTQRTVAHVRIPDVQDSNQQLAMIGLVLC